ncbi:MAG: TMEM43 family protein [Pseudomonadota bacterium]
MLTLGTRDSDRSSRSKGSVLFGLFLIWAGMTALWKNEVRFDLVRAAQEAAFTTTPSATLAGDNLSYTDRLSPVPRVKDTYVGELTGYLVVSRMAEIYAWDREHNSDGPDRWTLEWQTYPESNSRNRGLQQRLRGDRLLPREYRLGDLVIDSSEIRFVDAYTTLAPRSLTWRDRRLVPARTTAEYFYFPTNSSSNGGPQLGDERVSYRAIPVPAQATYFGRFDGQNAVVDDSGRRDGLINSLIKNEGLLHHLVAGNRDTAIDSIGSAEAKIKLYSRLGGTLAVVLGVHLLLAKVFALLLMIPFIGYAVERALFVVSLAVGCTLSLSTMLLGLLAAHPLVLLGLCAAIVAGFLALRRRATQQSEVAQTAVRAQYATQLEQHNLAEIEFMELARLAALDGEIAPNERKMLFEWARQRGWSAIVSDALIDKALRDDTGFMPTDSRPEQVANLVRIALADGSLSAKELDRIKAISRRAGLADATVHAVIKQIEAESTPRPA